VGYKRWKPSSRRNRRRDGSRRGAAQGADKTFFLIAGLFMLAILLLLGALALFTD
jgi:hypothetical protein